MLEVCHAIRASYDQLAVANDDDARAGHARSTVRREQIIHGHASVPSATGRTRAAQGNDQDFAAAYHAFQVSCAAPPPMVSCC